MPPAIVTEETEGYFEAEDSVGAWLDERCDVSPDQKMAWTSTRDLYRDFRAWMVEGKGYILPEGVFVARLETISSRRRGRVRHEGPQVRGFFGVKLLHTPPAQPSLNV